MRPSSRAVASATIRLPRSSARWRIDLGCPWAVTLPPSGPEIESTVRVRGDVATSRGGHEGRRHAALIVLVGAAILGVTAMVRRTTRQEVEPLEDALEEAA